MKFGKADTLNQTMKSSFSKLFGNSEISICQFLGWVVLAGGMVVFPLAF